jgi:chemotaxis protein MotB
MAKEKGATIVIKKVTVAAAGAHGGAWKVAFADFMTAMMAFFLVMWLMGSDEETKASISHYFNHPNTPYDKGRDPQSDTASPLGEKMGQGDTILKGADGGVPEDLVREPLRDLKKEVEENLGQLAFGIEFDADIEVLKFSLPGDELFEVGSSKIRSQATPYLDRLARIFAKVNGNVLIEGHLDSKPLITGEDPYIFSTQRAVAVMNYFRDKHKMDEDRFCPRGVASRRSWSASRDPAAEPKNRRVEFTISPVNECSR